ncbi:MAG: LytTR family DNA-binding domain-containing protein [Bacteroidota bacterium]
MNHKTNILIETEVRDLEKVISKAMDAPLHFNDSMFIKQNYRYHKIAYKDILFLKADRNHTFVHTTDRAYLIRHAINSLISGLVGATSIIQVHRSFAINMLHLSSFNETTAVVASEEIPIGPNYRRQFLSVFST